MKLYDVPVDLSEDEILTDLFKQNFATSFEDYEVFKDKFKVFFKVGPRGRPTTQLIVEVDKDLRKIIKGFDRLYLG